MSQTCFCHTVQILDDEVLKQAVVELAAQGIKCELIANAQPRMYFEDQLHRTMGRKTEMCDFVLKLEESRFDVGFIRQDDGSLLPVFDNLGHDVQQVIGIPFKPGKPFLDANGESYPNEAYAIAKLALEYSKQLTIKTAVGLGYEIESCEVDEQGQVQIMVGVEG